jgi:hypothetical protein
MSSSSSYLDGTILGPVRIGGKRIAKAGAQITYGMVESAAGRSDAARE